MTVGRTCPRVARQRQQRCAECLRLLPRVVAVDCFDRGEGPRPKRSIEIVASGESLSPVALRMLADRDAALVDVSPQGDRVVAVAVF